MMMMNSKAYTESAPVHALVEWLPMDYHIRPTLLGLQLNDCSASTRPTTTTKQQQQLLLLVVSYNYNSQLQASVLQ